MKFKSLFNPKDFIVYSILTYLASNIILRIYEFYMIISELYIERSKERAPIEKPVEYKQKRKQKNKLN